jgi:hypothetical protein
MFTVTQMGAAGILSNKVENKVKNKTRWWMRGGGRAGDPAAKVAVT